MLKSALSFGALLAVSATAHGAIVFTPLQVAGSLGAGSTAATGTNDIDITIPGDTGGVGDGYATRAGSVTYTFDVLGNAGEVFGRNIFSFLGAVAGNGQIAISVTVDDLVNPGQIASQNILVNAGSPPPAALDFTFSRASSNIRVTTTLQMSAPDTAGFEFANASLIEQRFLIPSPGALAVLGLGGFAALRRRR